MATKKRARKKARKSGRKTSSRSGANIMKTASRNPSYRKAVAAEKKAASRRKKAWRAAVKKAKSKRK